MRRSNVNDGTDPGEGLDGAIGGVEEVNNVATQNHADYGEPGTQEDDQYIPYPNYDDQTPYEHLKGNYEETTDWIASSETNVIAADPGVSFSEYAGTDPDKYIAFAIRQILAKERIPGFRTVGSRNFRTQSITLSPGGGLSNETSTRIARDDGRRSYIRMWAALSGTNDIWISHEKFTLNTVDGVRPGNVVSLKDIPSGILVMQGEGDIYVGNPAASSTNAILNVIIEYT